MAKHSADLILCCKQAGVAIQRLGENCDCKCMFCDPYVHPCTLRDGCPKIADLGSSKIFSMNVKEKYESKKR
jgi:PHD finger-like domain-containing protein 5A